MVIPVNLGEKSYDIYLEKGCLNKVGQFFDLDRNVMIVTDSKVPPQYVKAVHAASKRACIITIEAGEESKTLETFSVICEGMLKSGFTRKDCVVAVGGGVVGDLAGFAAACYMRGIDFYNVPTTLLAQVDSSVGGKTAVDFCGIKNIIGAFHQPKAVLIDPQVLATLDERQFACGVAEIIKIAATFDEELFETIEKEPIKNNLEDIIAKVVKNKANVVELDEKESGLRKVLNFGHTIGHGIESVTDYLHGECVALGMLTMASPEVKGRLSKILTREKLPTTCMADANSVIEAAMHDKKAEVNEITTVVVDTIGSYRFDKKNRDKLIDAYKEVSI